MNDDVDKLIATSDPEWLHWAAVDLPDSRYDPRLVKALMKGEEHGHP